jgi:hypothetical protein
VERHSKGRRKRVTDNATFVWPFGETSASVAGLRAAVVFDVIQTVGQELPHIEIVQGQPREYRERLRAFAATSPPWQSPLDAAK